MRLFIAVHPPENVLDQVAQLVAGFGVTGADEPDSSTTDPDAQAAWRGQRSARARIRWTTRSQWHVTLRFLGDLRDPNEVVSALERADLAAPGWVEASMGPAVERLGRGVLCVPVAGLDTLAVAVIEATAHIGQPPDPRPFHGHLTLARLPRKGRVDTSAWVGRAIGASWPVEAVHLMRSQTHLHGARYETLHAAPVGA